MRLIIVLLLVTTMAHGQTEDLFQVPPPNLTADENPNGHVIYFEQPVMLNKGDVAPYAGVLLDHEMFTRFNDRQDRVDAAEAAVYKQNDMLIDLQIQKITVEFERDNARSKLHEYTWISSSWWFLLGILAAGAAR